MAEGKKNETGGDAREAKSPARTHGQGKLVKVKVMRAVAHQGVRISPRDLGNGKLAPVDGVLPVDVAESYGPRFLEILGDAPKGAKIGPAE